LEIPQEDLDDDMMGDDSMPPMDDMGGVPDDMGDIPDDMGGEDPMAGGPDDMGGAPGDMGGEDPMAGGPDDMGGAPDDMGEGPEDMGGGNGHDELMQVADQLDTEDEAALIKYGKSMVDDSAAGGDDGGMMPESRFSFSRIISETLGSLLDKKDNDGIERPGKKLNSKLRGKKGNPFVSPY
jgi:hypothetical protein